MSLEILAALFTLALGVVSLTNRKIWIVLLTVAAVGIQIVLILMVDIDRKAEKDISDTNREQIIEEVLKARVQLKRIADMLPAE